MLSAHKKKKIKPASARNIKQILAWLAVRKQMPGILGNVKLGGTRSSARPPINLEDWRSEEEKKKKKKTSKGGFLHLAHFIW